MYVCMYVCAYPGTVRLEPPCDYLSIYLHILEQFFWNRCVTTGDAQCTLRTGPQVTEYLQGVAAREVPRKAASFVRQGKAGRVGGLALGPRSSPPSA